MIIITWAKVGRDSEGIGSTIRVRDLTPLVIVSSQAWPGILNFILAIAASDWSTTAAALSTLTLPSA